MTAETFRKVNKYKTHTERGYDGMPFEAIPTGLRQRVQAAVQIASGIVGLVPEITCQPHGIQWHFGNQYTDVFVFDGSFFQHAYHRAPDKIVYKVDMSSSRYTDQPPITAALGFDRNKSDELRGFGWAYGAAIDEVLKEYMPQGPYYGMAL